MHRITDSRKATIKNCLDGWNEINLHPNMVNEKVWVRYLLNQFVNSDHTCQVDGWKNNPDCSVFEKNYKDNSDNTYRIIVDFAKTSNTAIQITVTNNDYWMMYTTIGKYRGYSNTVNKEYLR